MRWLTTFLTCCLPISAAAHPHVFIDTGLEFIVDDAGQLTHVRVTWVYDEFYSLLVLEDMKLDQDADGVLTDAEEQVLAGFDAQWVEGYNGDLVVQAIHEGLEHGCVALQGLRGGEQFLLLGLGLVIFGGHGRALRFQLGAL